MRQVDHYRGTGRTTKQMLEAPHGAVFIWCNQFLDYPTALARKHGREDLSIVSPSWLEGRWRGLELTGLVVDHAVRMAQLTDRQFDGLQGARTRIRNSRL